MTYERFEDLPVWQTAAELHELAEELLEHEALRCSRAFKDQLDRAALSVSNNIAEGFERGTTNELLAFLYIARGSAGEVRSMLVLLKRKGAKKKLPAALLPLVEKLAKLAESCSRQLRAWADTLQNSDIKGQRHLNDGVRRKAEVKKADADFRKLMLEKLPSDHPIVVSARKRGEIP
jgi:four helix bundle protein